VQRADVAMPAPIDPQQAEASSAGSAAERRQMSILACQIRGLAAISAKLDLEDQGELMSSVRRAGADVAARFGGVTASALGDSIVIYFGCREAQEHDPERAVRAGLDLVDAVRSLDVPGALHAHIGVATGMMLVGAPTRSAEELAATGQALNIALRLQSTAPPDSVLITDRTRELVGDFFDYRAMEPFVLADDLPPVAVWRVTGESTKAGRFEALRRAGMHELVGRRSEMQLLQRCWSRVLSGAGQIVLVTGEPGIGKSRLVAEFQDERNAEGYGSLRYFGSPHRTDASLYAVIAELQRSAGFRRADPPSGKLAKLTALLDGPGCAARKGAMLVADLLGLPRRTRRPFNSCRPKGAEPRHWRPCWRASRTWPCASRC
jgi:class 3 adenylate cyclase